MRRCIRFQRTQREHAPTVEEEFEHVCSESMFRIRILEQRLSSHEEVALSKFQELEDSLSSTSRSASAFLDHYCVRLRR